MGVGRREEGGGSAGFGTFVSLFVNLPRLKP